MWTWQCEKVSDGSACEAVVLSELARAATAKESPQFKPTMGAAGERKFTLTIQKGSRSVSEVIISSLGKEDPIVNEILPPTKQVNKGELVEIQLETEKGSELEWELDGQAISPTQTSKLGKVLSDSATLLLNTDDLEAGNTYTVSLKSTDTQSGKSTTFEHEFTVSLPPKACSCDVSTENVVAMEDDFSVICVNCQNAEGTLKIEYGYIDEKTGIKVPLSTNEAEFSSKLPPTQSGSIKVYTTIIDTATSSIREKEFTVNVTMTPFYNVNALETKVYGWMEEGPSRDYAKELYKTTTIARVISEFTSTTDAEKQKITNLKGQLIDDMANSLAIIEQDQFKEEYLSMQVVGLEDILKDVETVSQEALETALDYYLKILDHALSSPNDINLPEHLDESMVKILDSMYLADEENNLMEKIYEALEKTSQVVVKSQHVGEYDVKVETMFATCVSNKDWQKDLSNKQIPFVANLTIVLPDNMDTTVTQASRKVPISYTFMTVDSAAYAESALGQIVTPVVKMVIDSTMPSELTQPISMTLPLSSVKVKTDDEIACKVFASGVWEDKCTTDRTDLTATCSCTKVGVVAAIRRASISTPLNMIIGIAVGGGVGLLLIVGVGVAVVAVTAVYCLKKKNKSIIKVKPKDMKMTLP